MAEFLKVNLSEYLTEDVFNIHEVVLEESALFQLHTLSDKILRDNPNAQHDGGFKIRLPNSLRGTGSTLKDFWTKFPRASDFLSSQHLTFENNNSGVMRLEGIRASDASKFIEAAKQPETFDSSDRNCCMQALDSGGPKEVVIHLYDCLLSKAVSKDTNSRPTPKYTKTNYQERQTMLVESDPSLTCVLIEKSMKNKKYRVQDGEEASGSLPTNTMTSTKSYLPINLTKDGNADNCSLYFNGVEETSDKYLYVTSNFAMAHLCHLNILTDLPEYLPGISNPFLYLGGLHSVFPIHIENMSLYSVNYNHLGHPKLIILIAPCEVSRLSLLLTVHGQRVTGNCIQQLLHKTDLVFPQWLIKHNIKFKVIIQHPGEFVVFAPNAAHTGANLGPNLAHACNYGSHDWLPFGSVASQVQCNCIEVGVTFDVTQLIRDHRKELLQYHLNRSLWTSFQDDHFQRSLIVPPSACYSVASDVTISLREKNNNCTSAN